MTAYRKPLPVPDEETAEFWANARDHRLTFQRCQHCGWYAHPPVLFCYACHNLDAPSFRFEDVSGRGRVVNWTVIHDAMVSGFEDDPPRVHVLVEMEEQKGLLYVATLEDGPGAPIAVGATVEVTFRDATPEATIPMFRLAATEGTR